MVAVGTVLIARLHRHAAARRAAQSTPTYRGSPQRVRGAAHRAALRHAHRPAHQSRLPRRVVDTTRSLQPDIIAVTGDLIDDRAEDVAAYARALGSLEAPLGVYMIAGNHDVYAGWDEVEQSLRSAKLGTVLVNEAQLLHRGDATLALVGTGDPAGGRAAASRAAPDVETRARRRARGRDGDRVRAQPDAVAGARGARRRADAERPHALGPVRAAEARLEPRVALPRARDGRAHATRIRCSTSARARATGDSHSGSARSRR